jgi:hypothetical protein
MRSDLDAVRERHVLRETREEGFVARIQSGDWGWAKSHAHAVPQPLLHGPGLHSIDPVPVSQRPGTAEGGF